MNSSGNVSNANSGVVGPELCFKPPDDKYEAGAGFYIIYSLIAALGLFGNAIIFLAYYFWSKRVLGKRETAVFLMRSQNVWDMVTCIFLIVNIYTRVYEASNDIKKHGAPPLRLFYSLRNVLIAIAMFHLALLSLDRTLAICRPRLKNSLWNAMKVKIIVATLSIILVVMDFSTRLFILYYPDCPLVRLMERIYSGIYGIASLILVIITYVCYFISFIGLWGLWKRDKRRRTESQMRTRTWTQEPQVKAVITHSPFGENIKTTNFEATIQTLVKKTSSYPGTNFTQIISRQYWTAQKRLVLVLLTISLSHSTSTLPLFLYNAGIISFPGYTFYYFFYVNCIMNPIIYFLSRKPLRQYVVCLCATPSLAFKPPVRELSGGI